MKKTSRTIQYRWPKVVIEGEESLPDLHRSYLVWLRRAMLLHITSIEYPIAKAMAGKYAAKVFGLKLAPYQKVEIQEAERLYKAGKNVVYSA